MGTKALASVSIARGPRFREAPLIAFPLGLLRRALIEPPEYLLCTTKDDVPQSDVYIEYRPLPVPLEVGETMVLQRALVDYGDNCRRLVYQGPDWQKARFGFTVNLSGWSSFPPHGFERGGHRPEGFFEVFHFLGWKEMPIWPSHIHGYLLTEPGRFPIAVFDGLTVRVHPGFHAVVAAPGCRIGYLWAYRADEKIVKEIRGGRYLEDEAA